jgi:hypothetical protein
MFQYMYRFTIDGVEHLAQGYAASRADAELWARDTMFIRNMNIPGEKTVLVPDSLKFGVTMEEVMRSLDEVNRKNPNNTTATELHPDFPNRILHEPVNPNAEVRDITG